MLRKPWFPPTAIAIGLLLMLAPSVFPKQLKAEFDHDAAYIAYWEAKTRVASFEQQKAWVVFDPLTPACWTVYDSGVGNSSVGSVSYIPCQVGRNRLAPSQRKALAEAEAKLGHPIP